MTSLSSASSYSVEKIFTFWCDIVTFSKQYSKHCKESTPPDILIYDYVI